ncbi:hypothetical protein JTB14_036577 [Gonioctena quinquepunctata]|nr:hypothetical protein JTB14_036577 [Gonioctena quinquepunctata]
MRTKVHLNRLPGEKCRVLFRKLNSRAQAVEMMSRYEGPVVTRKGKKLVPLGAAVEVLTGRVQLPTCATKRPTPRRQILKERDLLLGSFDDTSNLGAGISYGTEEIKKTLLDEDPEPLPEAPIDLSNPIPFPQIAAPVFSDGKDIINEFDVIAKATEDDDDIEFEALAAESLAKTPSVVPNVKFVSSTTDDFKWGAFETEPIDVDDVIIDDPFDTSFATKIIPDLKADKHLFDEINSSVAVNGEISERSQTSYSGDRISEKDRSLIQPGDRDLIGGSNVDLRTGCTQSQQLRTENNFDLFVNKTVEVFLEDNDFDPRAEERTRGRTPSRPDILSFTPVKTVSFDIPSPNQNALNPETNKVVKPLTPFYTRKNSIPELPISEDPFDTSFAANVAPGRAELRIIESELFDPEIERNLSLEDKNFDPRDETKAKIDKVVDSIKEISKPKPKLSFLSESIDLLAIDNDSPAKVLTPGDVRDITGELSYCDPFDTSIACNILPGKTELKILESELISSTPGNTKRGIDDLLNQSEDILIRKPLAPSESVTSPPVDQEDFDPFDTSCNSFEMAANPFLFNEEPFTSPSSAGSNPFLMDDDPSTDGAGLNDNPFLSQSAATISTNPFSFDPMELEPAEAEVPNIQADTNNFDPFGDIGTSSSLSFSIAEPINTQPIIREVFVKPDPAPLQKPSELDLKFSHQPLADGPPRPPPPRPPPSKETQDLLMSVMGAMNATSSSLLNKIPPTRSPSPISMRDLHSPSPTPEPSFGDLLDVNGRIPEVTNTDGPDLFSLEQDSKCDINQNPAVIRAPETIPQAKPPRPTPPVRPPKPPLPPMFNQTAKENPKKEPTPQPVEVKADIVEEMDLFGPPQKKEVTNADIMNLFNAPKQAPIKTDLLTDLMEPDVIMQTQNDMMGPAVTTNTQDASNIISPLSQANETMKENLISSDPSQEDLQMDLSDSHSKCSVSSVTFNPFAAADDISQANTPQPPLIEDNFSSEINQNEIEMMEEAFRETTETSYNFGSFTDSVVAQNQAVIKEEANIFGVSNTTVPNSGDIFGLSDTSTAPSVDIFGISNASVGPTSTDIFGTVAPQTVDAFGTSIGTISMPNPTDAFDGRCDDFDDFAKKFDSVKGEDKKDDVWGNEFPGNTAASSGFGQDDGFDAFLALQEPPSVPQSTPCRISKNPSQESDEDKDFSVFIRPKGSEDFDGGILPTIAPPPVPTSAAFVDTSPRFNPFDNENEVSTEIIQNDVPYDCDLKRSDSQETPPTPLFDDDVSQPLEPFPRINFTEDGWEMHLRQPNKKKITGQRFWKKIFVKIQYQTDCVLLQLYNLKEDKDPFQELPLQPCYSVSDIGAQQYDQFGKIFTLKLQYIFYKERPGVRPGQVKKAERITNKLSQFAAYAIQGDYQGVKEFGSDLKKLGLPVEHAPQVSQLMKLGSLNYEDLKQFSFCIEEALFKLQAHRDRALHYKMEEVQITAVDELYVEQDADGHIEKQIARVRLFFLGFLTGMPDVELGINDMRRQGKEVVGRHDIIPVVTEEWIRLEDVEFHSCIQQDDYNDTHIIKFKPPDACYIELLRFRVRPPKNRELPLQLKAQICVTGYKVELRADVLVPGFASRKLGQIPCEDVMIRFPIPECWIYLFRVEKHFRYGSVKSAHRRTGKIKGIERILGTVETLQENLIEVTSGQAKYEHQHRAIVWRCPRLPKEGQGAYTTHNMVCRVALTSYDQMPEKLAEYCYVEFTMPATQVSHTTCRSVSMQNSDSDEPPEKYVRYLARHEYRVGIEHTEGDSPNPYAAATYVSKPAPPAPTPVNVPAKVPEESSSDSD